MPLRENHHAFIVGTSQERWSDGAQEGVSVLCLAHAHQPCEHSRLEVDDTSHPNDRSRLSQRRLLKADELVLVAR
jgi:hypothetical protein